MAAGIKMRSGPDGIHFFNRVSGNNLLVDEIVPPKSEWAKSPRQVSIALTNTCDLACSYCFAPKMRASLPFERIVSWISELDSNGTLGVGFGGGEPTLYPRFEELCAYTSKNTGLAVTFTSHGHHLKEKLVTSLKGNAHFVRVSMDGIGATYERLRGRSFNELVKRLVALKKNIPFGINYVINESTFPEIDEAVEFAASIGASEFLMLPELAVGGKGGIRSQTTRALRNWVRAYSGSIPLAISEKGAEDLPTCNPFTQELGLRAYVHIDATGMLKSTSYDSDGVNIEADGVLKALSKLKIKLKTNEDLE